MPNLNEFIGKQNADFDDNSQFEKIDGVRGCSKCKEDVEGAYWSENDKKMVWQCSSGHVTEFEVD